MHNNMLLVLNNDFNFITYKNTIENLSGTYFRSITEGVKFLYFTLIDVVSFNRTIINKIFISLQAAGLLPVELTQIYQAVTPNLDKKSMLLTSTKLLERSSMLVPESFDIKFYIKLYNKLSANIFIIYFPTIMILMWVGFFIFLCFISQKRGRIILLILMAFTTVMFMLLGILILNTNFNLQDNISIVFENNIYKENPFKTNQLPYFFLIKDNKLDTDLDLNWFLSYNPENLNYKHFDILESPFLYKKTQINSLTFYTGESYTLFWYDTKNKCKLNFLSDYATSLWGNHTIYKMIFNPDRKFHSSIISHNFILHTESIINDNLNKKIVSFIDYKINENQIKYHIALLKLIFLVKTNSNLFNSECFTIIISTSVCTIFIALITNSVSLESSNKCRIKHFQEFKSKNLEKSKKQFTKIFLKKEILKLKGGPGLIEYTSLEKSYFKKNTTNSGVVKVLQNFVYNRVSTTIIWVSIFLGLMATPMTHPSIRVFSVLTMLIFILVRLNLLKFKETYALIKTHYNLHVLNKNNLIWFVSIGGIFFVSYPLLLNYHIISALKSLYFLIFVFTIVYCTYFIYLNIRFNSNVFLSTLICITTTILLCLQFNNSAFYLWTIPQTPFNLKFSFIITTWMWSFLRLWRLCVRYKQNEFFLYWGVVILPVNFLVSAVLIQHFTIGRLDLIFLILYAYESICLILYVFKYLRKNGTSTQSIVKKNLELSSVVSVRICIYTFTTGIYVIVALLISTFKGVNLFLMSSILLLTMLSILVIVYIISPITGAVRTGNLMQLVGALQNFRFLKNLFNFYLMSNIGIIILFIWLMYGLQINF